MIGFEHKYEHLIKNTWMSDKEGEYPDCLFVLQNFSFKNPDFTHYEHKFTKSPYFIQHMDIKDKVLYIFKFPNEYLKEYNEFKKSNYSTFSEEAKKKILRYWTLIEGRTSPGANFVLKVRQILYNDPKLRLQLEKDLNVKIDINQELGSFVDPELETIDLKNLHEYCN